MIRTADLKAVLATTDPPRIPFEVFAKETKAGYKTTEFWLTIVTNFLVQIQAVKMPGKYGDTFFAIVSIAVYVLSRGWAKSGVPTEEWA